MVTAIGEAVPQGKLIAALLQFLPSPPRYKVTTTLIRGEGVHNKIWAGANYTLQPLDHGRRLRNQFDNRGRTVALCETACASPVGRILFTGWVAQVDRGLRDNEAVADEVSSVVLEAKPGDGATPQRP